MTALANAIVALASMALVLGLLGWFTVLPAIGLLWIAGWLP